jgi:hypothetical protein
MFAIYGAITPQIANISKVTGASGFIGSAGGSSAQVDTVTLAAMPGRGDDVREAHSAPPDALRAGNADLQGADGRSYKLAIYLDRREPGVASVVGLPREPLTRVALPRLLWHRAALVKQKGPKAQKLGAILDRRGPQTA